MDYLIGIDYGTTNSAAVYNDAGKELVIEASSGQNTMPSAVAINADGSFLVGQNALRRLIRGRKEEARYVFTDIKREFGRKVPEGEALEEQHDVDADLNSVFRGPDRNYTPQELAAEVLRTIKGAAERRIGKKVRGAVITVPAGYTPDQIEATYEAAELAGWKRNKITLLTEPEAAAIAYSFDKGKFRRVLVVDIGGGTSDVVLMDTGSDKLSVLNKASSQYLGGIDFDRRVESYIIDSFDKDHGIDLRTKPISMLKMRPVVEDTKKELTDVESSTIFIEDGALDTEGAGRFVDVKYTLTREQFEGMVQDLIARIVELVNDTLSGAGVEPEQVQDVVLVGGMTRVPAIRKALADMFGLKKIRDTISPDLAIAKGAAIVAAEKDGRLPDRRTYDQVSAHAYGIAGARDQFVLFIPKGADAGTKEVRIVSNQKKNQTEIPIAVLRGQNKKASTNELIGEHRVTILPQARGSANIELTFEVLDDGNLAVYGQNLDTEERFEIIGAG